MDKAAEAINKTNSDLIRNILSSYTFIDFGLVTAYTSTTVDIDLINKRSGFVVHLTGIELLSLGSSSFSLKVEPIIGDLVILLSTRQYIASLADITEVQEKGSKLSYDLECLKAVQIAPAKQSKVIMSIDKNGVLEVIASGDIKVTSSSQIHLNGSGKTFTLFTALKNALDSFINLLNSHTHSGGGSGPPTTPMTLDISSAESTTVKTGG